jgi:hypothetical protein
MLICWNCYSVNGPLRALGAINETRHVGGARHHGDAKLYEIGAGTSEIPHILIGREQFDATA